MKGRDKELVAALAIAGRAGLIVLALGVADFIHGIVTAPAGTVHLRFAGLAAGLLMLFGGLGILALVRWLALLAAAVQLGGMLSSLFVVPAGLTLTQIRLYPLAYTAGCVPWLFSVAIALVAAVSLSHPQLLAARARAGRSVHSARIPLALGALLAIGAAVSGYRVLNGEAAQKARRAVAEKLGPGYQYYTQSLSTTIGKPAKTSALVQAWNEHEVRNVPVQWQEQVESQ